MLDFSVTFIITIINIAVLFLIMRVVLFKPVTKFMAERAKRIQDNIDQAERDKAQAKNLLEQYEEKLKGAEAEIDGILNISRQNAEREAEQIIAEGRAEAANIIAVTRKQLETERQAVFARFRAEAAVIVIAAASRLAERELNNDDNRRYADMLLEELALDRNRGY